MDAFSIIQKNISVSKILKILIHFIRYNVDKYNSNDLYIKSRKLQ